MAASLVPAGGKMRKQYSLGAYLSFRVGRLLSRGNVKRECWPEGGQESFASSFLQQCDEEGGESCVSAFNTRFVSFCLSNLIRVAQLEKNWRRRSCTGLIEKKKFCTIRLGEDACERSESCQKG